MLGLAAVCLLLNACSKDDGKDEASNNLNAEMQSTTNSYTFDADEGGIQIVCSAAKAYLEIKSFIQFASSYNHPDFRYDYYYYQIGEVRGLKEMEPHIFELPKLNKISYERIELSEGMGYITGSCKYDLSDPDPGKPSAYKCTYISKINKDASGNVISVFYYEKAFTPFVGWN